MQGKAEAWELCKENIQPLRTGRSVACLKTAFQPSQKDLETLNAERQQFEEEILAGDCTNDPIDTWDRYIKWTIQNYPQGHGNDRYKDLLQKYIGKFLNYNIYQNDPRYVKAWLSMALITDNSINTFRYMVSKDIGKKCACLYIAWAEEHEKYNKWKKAHEIYEMGVENNAKPLDLLMKHKNAFEIRSARAAIKDVQKYSQEEVSKLDDRPEVQRITLGALEGKGKTKKVGTTRIASNAQPLIKQQQPLHIKHSQNKKTIQIYNDNESQSASQHPPHIGSWNSMPNSKQSDKENVFQKPDVWKGAKVKQTSRTTSLMKSSDLSSSRPKPQPFTIFHDDTSDSNTNTNSVVPSSARKLSKTVEKLLTERKPSKKNISSLHQQIAESYGENINDSNVTRMYPVEKVYSVMGEFSLEEIWATSRRKKRKEEEQRKIEAEKERRKVEEEKRMLWEERKNKERKSREGLQENKDLLKIRDDQINEISSLMHQKVNVAEDNGLLTKSTKMSNEFNSLTQIVDTENIITEIPISDESSNKNENYFINGSKLTQPSPTMFTKQAIAEIEDMFTLDFKPIEDQDLMETETILLISPLPKQQHRPFTIFCDEDVDEPLKKKSNFTIFNEVENKKLESPPCKKFSIFNDKDDILENSENIPTPEYKPGVKRTNLAGILQPAVGFELQTLSSSSSEEEEQVEDQEENFEDVFPLEALEDGNIIYLAPLNDIRGESSGSYFD